jgi:hypothetical protein
MNKLIKHSVKQDRASWFQDMLEEGDWNAVQKSASSSIVISTKCAHRMATYYQHMSVQKR